MKPNQLQVAELQKYLRDNLKYRETFAEFYDHILTALENMAVDLSFEAAVKSIVTKDFGGTEGMRLIEDKYQRLSLKEMQKKYLNFMLDNFKMPGLFITIGVGGLAYFAPIQEWFTFTVFLLVLFTLRVVPICLQIINRIMSPYIEGAPGSSIKKKFSQWQNVIPGIIITIWLLLSPGFLNNSSHLENTSPLIMSVLIFFIGIDSLTYYKVYHDDIKARSIVN